ncbi:hypothetical protein [Nocardia sputorum]|uniref:hypothetical protein n=1 Tax=Nocardia sputorum TaxID=2984338 RepID=UPI0024901EB3|nr:hypothetical protein [Nocardia sputorum]
MAVRRVVITPVLSTGVLIRWPPKRGCAGPRSPIDEFSSYIVRVHKITPDDVAGQPGFAQRLPDVLAVIGDLPVAAHNTAGDCSFGGIAQYGKHLVSCSLFGRAFAISSSSRAS